MEKHSTAESQRASVNLLGSRTAHCCSWRPRSRFLRRGGEQSQLQELRIQSHGDDQARFNSGYSFTQNNQGRWMASQGYEIQVKTKTTHRLEKTGSVYNVQGVRTFVKTTNGIPKQLSTGKEDHSKSEMTSESTNTPKAKTSKLVGGTIASRSRPKK